MQGHLEGRCSLGEYVGSGMVLASAGTLVGSPEGNRNEVVAGSVNVNFPHVAKRLQKNLNRGWQTPDPVFCDNPHCSVGIAGDVASGIPSLHRGWKTPDPAAHMGAQSFDPQQVYDAVCLARTNMSEDEAGEKAVHRRLLKGMAPLVGSGSSLTTASTDAPDAPDTGLSGEGPFEDCGASTASLASSSAQWQVPSGTIIFVDWDDTIFPTSWIEEKPLFKGWLQDKVRPEEVLGTEDAAVLDDLDKVARAFLSAASCHGRLVCVTLAQRPWQGRTMQAFMPRVASLWKELGIEVAYAHEERLETRRALQPIACSSWCINSWPMTGDEKRQLQVQILCAKKRRAMSRRLRRFYGREHGWKNVLSFGDGPAERRALQGIGWERKNPMSQKSGKQKRLRIKTVKMLESPDCAQIIQELQLLQAWVPSIAAFDGDFDVSLDDEEGELLEAQHLLEQGFEKARQAAQLAPELDTDGDY